jgi:hypothetical protein
MKTIVGRNMMLTDKASWVTLMRAAAG